MKRSRAMAIASLALGFAETASAHLVNSGIGPFYDGALHLLLSPGDVLGLVGIGLLAGLRGKSAGRIAVLAGPVAWLLGGLAGFTGPSYVELPTISVVTFLIIGVLVAMDPKWLPTAGVAALAGLFGALHGMLNGSALATTGTGLVSLGGVVVAAFVATLLIAAVVSSLQLAAARVAVRVVGSWIAAVGILMLGWLAAG